MKYKTFFFIIFAFNCSYGQSVTVLKQTQRIKNEKEHGYSTMLGASKGEVEAALQRYLKSFGKAKQQEGVWIVPETTLNGKTYSKQLHALAKGGGEKTTAWIGVNFTEWAEDSLVIASQLEGLVKTFGVNFYRDKIQAQIDEAQRALEALERQQQRNLTENKNVTQRIENNKKEHLQLTKAIQSNRQDSVNLQLRFEQNLNGKDSLFYVLEKVKKALEFQKERQRKVN